MLKLAHLSFKIYYPEFDVHHAETMLCQRQLCEGCLHNMEWRTADAIMFDSRVQKYIDVCGKMENSPFSVRTAVLFTSFEGTVEFSQGVSSSYCLKPTNENEEHM